MNDGQSFHGAPSGRGRRDARLGLAIALVVTLIGLAIVKPWGSSGRPTGSTGPGAALASPPGSAGSASPGSPPAAPGQPLPVAFTAPALQGGITWAGLDWQRLASDSPLSVVRAVATRDELSVAIGDIPGATSTAVWSSNDDTHWQPVGNNTPTTFWPNLSILALATLPGKFVAISAMNDYLLHALPPVIAWSSTDGQSWTPAQTLPVQPATNPSGFAALVAAGPHDLVVATSGLGARIATSIDGSNWVVAPANAFPADFALTDIEGGPQGFVAIGTWTKGEGPDRAAALWSADGRTWPNTPTILPAESDSQAVSTAVTLSVGDQGMVASGLGGLTGSVLWWQSADGRHWQALQAFPPLAGGACPGGGCNLAPTGTLVGDGHRLVALQAGLGRTGWVSSDGQQWTPLAFSGDLPTAQAAHATLLPSGVLVSNGTTTWFGQAGGG
jgi:hypothetical protein